jgi:monoamine oxidase
MGPGAALSRRAAIAAGLGSALLAGCRRGEPALAGGWIGASHERGHRWRELGKSGSLPAPGVQRRAPVVIVGAGIAGLAAARAFMRQGIDDVVLLELEDQPGGHSRGHQIAGLPCPLGAHYLPLPGTAAHEVAEWLFEIGLLRHELGRTVAEDAHLCHSPQERLFIDGAWAEGLLPPAEPGSATHTAYRRFAAAVAGAQKLGFAIPTQRAAWTPAHRALDAITFDTWLASQGLSDARLRWYLDYCCRDDYGAGLDRVSAWAGLHYFASRHGFHAPGDESDGRDAVFTWPEGNAWLVQRLAAPLAARLHPGRVVLRVDEGRHGVTVLAWDEHAGRAEAWTAPTVLLAVPLAVAVRVVTHPPQALRDAAAQVPQAPWLVANLHLDRPLLDRPGAPPSWDNVIHGSTGLGYVDAGHQRLRPVTGPTVLSAYHALPAADRARLLSEGWPAWAQHVLDDLAATHPDLRSRVQRIELQRWGHGMAVPVPGVRSSPALAALRARRGRLRFAHSDLAGYSVFEEAFTLGTWAAGG